MDHTIPVAVALGSNLGARESHIHRAAVLTGLFVEDVRLSSIHETAYVGPADPQPPFLNAALIGRTTLPARELLRALLDIERAFGRTRPYQDAPRPIDLDLILYGASVIDQPGLVVPIRASGSAGSSSSRWPRWPRTGSIRSADGASRNCCETSWTSEARQSAWNRASTG